MTHHSPGRKQNLFTFQNTAQNFQVKLQLHSTNLSQYFATLTKGVVETVYSPPTKPHPPTQTIITNSAAGKTQLSLFFTLVLWIGGHEPQSLQQSVAELKMFIPQMICGEKEYQNQTNKCSDGIPKSYVGYKCQYLCPSHRRKTSKPLNNIDLSEGTLIAPECFHRRKAASSRRRFPKGL